MEPGSAFFTRGQSDFNLLTAFFSRRKGEAPTKATHVGGFINAERIFHAVNGYGVTEDKWADYCTILNQRGVQWAVHQPAEPLRNVQLALYTSRIREMCGVRSSARWRYSKSENVLQGLDLLLEKVSGTRIVLFRRAGALWRHGVICSKAYALALIEAGVLESSHRWDNPDDLHDWCVDRCWPCSAKSPGW